MIQLKRYFFSSTLMDRDLTSVNPSIFLIMDKSFLFCFWARKATDEFFAARKTFWPSTRQSESSASSEGSCLASCALNRLCDFALSYKRPSLLPGLKFVGFSFVLSCIYEKIPQFCQLMFVLQ